MNATTNQPTTEPTTTTIPAAASAMQPAAVPATQIINQITMAAAPPTVVVVVPSASGPGLLVRGLYFVFVGCWLGALCTAPAWMLNATVIGLPLGLMLINRLPQIITLKPTAGGLVVSVANGAVVVQQGGATQYSLLVRALYYVLVGWWFSGLWLGLAWGILAGTLGLGLPLSFWMFNRAPAVTTLAR